MDPISIEFEQRIMIQYKMFALEKESNRNEIAKQTERKEKPTVTSNKNKNVGQMKRILNFVCGE